MAQRYVPPHLRKRGGPGPSTSTAGTSTRPDPASTSTRATATTGGLRPRSAAPTPPSRPFGPGSSGGGGSYALASPASDIRPATRSLRGDAAQPDEMEMIQSVSRSGGDGAEGDALKDWALQERYRRYINERLENHYRSFPTPRDTAPAAEASDELEGLGSIVLLFRKLREGVVASHRIDEFAVEVFESSTRISILARNLPQLLSSLSGLVPGLYLALDTAVKSRSKGKVRATEDSATFDLAAGLESLHLGADPAHPGAAGPDPNLARRTAFASLLLLYHLSKCSDAAFDQTLQELTAPTTRPLPRPFAELLNLPPRARVAGERPFLPRSAFRTPILLARMLSEERFDSCSYFAVLGDARLSGYERAIIGWMKEGVRERAWLVLKKAYLEVEVGWAGKWLGMGSEEVEKFVNRRGGSVVGNRVKLR